MSIKELPPDHEYAVALSLISAELAFIVINEAGSLIRMILSSNPEFETAKANVRPQDKYMVTKFCNQ